MALHFLIVLYMWPPIKVVTIPVSAGWAYRNSRKLAALRDHKLSLLTNTKFDPKTAVQQNLEMTHNI